jgi:hypothetical protein
MNKGPNRAGGGKEADFVAEHYRPVAIKAVLAVHAIKRPPPEPVDDEPRFAAGPLPEGFHMPPSVYDD